MVRNGPGWSASGRLPNRKAQPQGPIGRRVPPEARKQGALAAAARSATAELDAVPF
jgi:hypothetical protein